jgi:hypothetical protein
LEELWEGLSEELSEGLWAAPLEEQRVEAELGLLLVVWGRRRSPM